MTSRDPHRTAAYAVMLATFSVAALLTGDTWSIAAAITALLALVATLLSGRTPPVPPCGRPGCTRTRPAMHTHTKPKAR